MTTDSDIRDQPYTAAGPLSGRFARALLVVLLLGAGTWIVGLIGRSGLSADIEDVQLQESQVALDRIETEFRDMQSLMMDEAARLAGDDRLIRALREDRPGGDTANETLVRMLSDYTLAEYGAVEIYDQQPRLISWAGNSIPLDSAPSEAGFLDSFQSSIAFDGERHSAMVVWWPVRDGTEPVGAVRILRMIVRLVPVRNEYLRDYTLDEEWSRLTGLDVRVDLNVDEAFDPVESRFARTFHGADGRPLIRVHVEPPDEGRLFRKRSRLYDDLSLLWLTVAMLMVLVASGRFVSRSERLRADITTLMRFLAFAVLAAGVRAAMLSMNVPARWQTGKMPFSPLFDPEHLASGFAGGLMRTSGDLAVSALLIFYVAVVFVRITRPFHHRVTESLAPIWGRSAGRPPAGVQSRVAVAVAIHVALVAGLLTFLSRLTERAVLDSTLDYFERSGLLPPRLVLLVFGALLVVTVAVAIVSSRLLWVCVGLGRPETWAGLTRARVLGIGIVAGVGTAVILFYVTGMSAHLSVQVLLIFVAVIYALLYFGPLRRAEGTEWLHLRSVVPAVVLLSMLLYPILERGLESDRAAQMEEAALSFEEEMDSRVMFAIGQVLSRTAEAGETIASNAADSMDHAVLDSMAGAVTIGELISSLGTHDISVTLFSPDGKALGRYEEVRRRATRQALDIADEDEFELVRAMFDDRRSDGPMIEKMTGDSERFIYAGFAPVPSAEDVRAWVLVRARPHEIAREGAQAFPRVLVPSGYYGDHYADMSLAEFQDGIMVRNFGRSFGRYSLAADVEAELRTHDVLWITERIRDRDYITLYRRVTPVTMPHVEAGPEVAARTRIIAVRLPEISVFDHLYYLLRITIAGLFLGLPVYLAGIVLRVHREELPARRVRFQDKVLNAFFVVGLVTVAVTGWVGWEVVTGENERAVESWLRQHLMRVEDTLSGSARGEELSYRVLERTDLDSLSSRVGLDLNIYRGAELERSSRPQLVRDRLIDTRLPIQAYEALFLDGFRFVSVDQSLGSFYYTAGYLALTDERGEPRYVVSLPTLPEQERIEEERARTIAYLFGALLLLVLVVMVTASLLANALARPIARLRAGLVAVSEGHFESIGPIRSRDEIGDLVDSFNTMQEQIVESRELLAQQERQLAWREMARQVAHEIKNPLTPMRLSIQHLRTAFSRMRPTESGSDAGEKEPFDTKFNRTTTTLIEQIDALARIADGFSSFGRMPQVIREPLDLNTQIEAAVALMRNETDMTIEADLSDAPLVIDGDKEAIRRLFINLIKNAIHAIPEVRDGRIELSTSRFEREDGTTWAQATVSDNGTGIPEALRDKIFVPSFSTKTSGTGLGLAIVRKTIEDLGGEIEFETEVGAGTVFRIFLQLGQH